ncbi:GTP-binding protein [Leucobacter sp. USCH14]|uniref:GTP-binding protein n=1 Tax=Leucobacter sp. USCH14 TaxID=3024838 RepID=UPI0030A5D4AC
MQRIEITAVLGACAPERRAFAERRSARTGAAMISAARLAQGSDPLLEAVALVPWTGASGAVIELPAETRATEVIGALDAESERMRLTHLVCVVDALHVLTDVMRDDYVSQRGGSLFVARAELLITQLEYASQIVFVNWESLATADLSALMALANHLAPKARLSLHQDGYEPITEPLTFSRHQDRPGWIALLNDEFDPYMTDPRVAAARYVHERPLHPGRLQTVLDERIEPGEFGFVVRSAGFCRLATRPRNIASWDHVGRVISFEPVGGDAVSAEAELLAIGQDLAFIGIDLDTAALAAALDDAALTDEEFAAGPSAWLRLLDPFPEWLTADESHG